MITKTTKLTFREWWALTIQAKKYRVNHNTKEIHRLEHKHVNCLKSKREKTSYVTFMKAMELIKKDRYNGCSKCWEEMDTG